MYMLLHCEGRRRGPPGCSCTSAKGEPDAKMAQRLVDLALVLLLGGCDGYLLPGRLSHHVQSRASIITAVDASRVSSNTFLDTERTAERVERCRWNVEGGACHCHGWQSEGGRIVRGGTTIEYCGRCDHHISWHRPPQAPQAQMPRPPQPFAGQGHRLASGGIVEEIEEVADCPCGATLRLTRDGPRCAVCARSSRA